MAHLPIPGHLASAYEGCLGLARSHYENFPVASLLMPGALRPHIAALYAFARTADDFADEDAPGRTPAARLRYLKTWERDFRRALAGKDTPPVLKAFAYTVRAFAIPVKLPLDLLKAFRMDVTVRRYPTWDRLLYYSRHSADPVGRMVLLMCGYREEHLHRLSDFFCSGLQLINFWQDTSVDLKRGRIYYPRSEWRKAGVTEKDLLKGRDSDATRTLVKNAVDFTERLFAKARPLLKSVRGRPGLELKANYLGGLGILRKIRRMDYNVFASRPAWTPPEKAGLAFQALFFPMPGP